MKKISVLASLILQLSCLQADELAKTYIEYASGWTSSDIANDVKAKLDLLQKNAEKVNKSIRITDIKTSPHWGSFFILYEVTDKTPANIYVEIASGWSREGLANDISIKLGQLYQDAEKENKLLKIIGLKILDSSGYALILYEISDKISEKAPPSHVHFRHIYAIKESSLANDLNIALGHLQVDKPVKILDLEIVNKWNCAFILYEISE